MPVPPFAVAVPQSDQVTPYDERHLVTYLRLLDAASQGADWREATQVIFGIDPGSDLDLARQLHDNHLNRARWMTSSGYKDLLDRS